MCCFSGPVEQVQATKIFARKSAPDRQVLAYQMTLMSSEPVAMILPLPTPPNAASAVRFISLEGYRELFEDLEAGFPDELSAELSLGNDAGTIEVVRVGDFEASFVPSLKDFARLDPRFQLPPGTLDRVPLYADWGFAVFQLAPSQQRVSERHPMAFEFFTKRPLTLFFPTMHLHDGTLHATAPFAHELYAQGIAPDAQWGLTRSPAKEHVDIALSQGLVDAQAPIARRRLYGERPNEDVWVSVVTAP